MGGVGSGRWRGRNRRSLVEDCLSMDVLDPSFKALLRLDFADGKIEWPSTRGTGPLLSVNFILSVVEPDGSRRITFDFADDPYQPELVVVLEPATVGFSRRVYFRCPRCNQRVRKLFVAPRKLELCCRACAGLTYLSSRQHDRRIGLCRKNPRLFLEQRSHLQSPRSRLVTSRIYWAAMQQRAHGR